MARKDIAPVDGKFRIQGRDGRDLILEFVNPGDQDNHIVEELTGDDLEDKLPSPRPTWEGKPISWFANYSVYTKSKGQRQGYASVPYRISLTVASGTTYLVYHGRALHDVTKQLAEAGHVTLTAGDPPWGQSP